MTEQAFRDADLIVGVGVKPPNTTRSYYAETVGEAVMTLQKHWRFANTRVAVLVGNHLSDDEKAFLRTQCGFISSNNSLGQRTNEAVATMLTKRIVAGLSRLQSVPWATQAGRPMAGAPAFLVAAGASLDLNGHLLPEVSRKGYIIAVNTSCGAVTRHGITPDATVCIDRSDNTEGLSRSGGTVHVLDLSAHGNVWALPCEQQYAVINNDAVYTETAINAGAMPLNYRGTCMATAFSLARAWGASPIIFVGQDLAFFLDDGRYYAKGTPYESVRYYYDEEEGVVKFRSEHELKRTLEWEVLVAESWGGEGDVMTSTMMVDFGIWLANAAHASGNVINATEHGLRLGGMQERRLREVVAELPDIDKRSLVGLAKPPADKALAEQQRIKQQCERILAASPADAPWEIEKLPLLHPWAVGELFRLERAEATAPDEKVALLREAVLMGARELLEVMG